ncbi:hypothetical protein BC829DRAFT_414315 [Chytridium lagenaria]|nr:hypothetical protein BC829DRAFT_414315 [Chytridium lagenaria]
MVEIQIQRLPDASPGRPEPSYLRGLGEFSIVGTITVQSSFPRTIESISLILSGQYEIAFGVDVRQYCRRVEHLQRTHSVPFPNQQINPRQALVIPFNMEIPMEVYRKALTPQYMAFSGRPMEEEMITAKSTNMKFRPETLSQRSGILSKRALS